MAVELDAKHVVNFPLQPVRGCPNGDARRDRSAVGDLRFHPHALVARKGIEDPHDIELLFTLQIMHGGDIDAVVKLFFVAQQTQNVWDQRAVNGKIVLSQIRLRVETRAVPALVFFNQRSGPRHRNGTGRLGGRGGFSSLGGRRCGTLCRRRLLLTFQRRWWNRRFGFLGHPRVCRYSLPKPYRYKSHSLPNPRTHQETLTFNRWLRSPSMTQLSSGTSMLSAGPPESLLSNRGCAPRRLCDGHDSRSDRCLRLIQSGCPTKGFPLKSSPTLPGKSKCSPRCG